MTEQPSLVVVEHIDEILFLKGVPARQHAIDDELALHKAPLLVLPIGQIELGVQGIFRAQHHVDHSLPIGQFSR